MKRFVIVMLLVVFILTLAVGCGEKKNTLQIKVQDILTDGDDVILSLKYKNDTGSTVSYGWVNSCKIKVTTDEGTTSYAAPHMGRIQEGRSTTELRLPNCSPAVEKVVITELCQLDSRGLPDKEIHNAVIYNDSKDINTFEDNFGFFSSPRSFFKCIPFAAVGIFLLTLLNGATGLFSKIKLPKISFSGHDHNWNHIDMANQMHQEAVATHQREVERQLHQEAADFGMRSVTPIDHGGFIPPPPDPPNFF